MTVNVAEINQQVAEQRERLMALYKELERVIVGQRVLIERLMIGLMTGGHILLEGVPGLAKTLAVRTLAQGLRLNFRRIQFTPDLLPADVIGTQIYNPRTGDFTVKKGPIFANLVLADEINRAPAKVQSALLEAMQEKQVTIGEASYPLEQPFLVMATQNPIEQEGTYHLPEAQVDRFMLKLKIGYPTKDEELAILNRMSVVEPDLTIQAVLAPADIFALRQTIDRIYVDDKIKRYIVDVVHSTRQPGDYGLDIAPVHPVWRQSAGNDLSDAGGQRASLSRRPRLRHAARRQVDRPGRAPASVAGHLRGGGGGHRGRGFDPAHLRSSQGAVTWRFFPQARCARTASYHGGTPLPQ